MRVKKIILYVGYVSVAVVFAISIVLKEQIVIKENLFKN